MEPNLFAYLMLLIWPLWALLAFYMFRPSIAAMLVLTAGAMFLPCVAAIDFPVVPPLDKESLPPLAALVACMVFARDRLRGTKPFRGIEFLAVVTVIGVCLTTITNGDPVIQGSTTLPGLSMYDLIASVIKLTLRAWVPFYLGRAVFRTARDLRDLMVGLALAGLIYSLLVLIEIRMSPQFHMWFYGFHQSEFMQTMRFGGYRPKVFMRHGLNLALFMLLTLIATTALAKAKVSIGRLNATVAAFYLTVVLLLCKSMGAIVYALVAIPLVAFASVKRQMQVAALIAAIIVGYPAIRLAGLFPAEDISDFFAAAINEERGGSLGFRLLTEETVLNRAYEKFLFGWGPYARGFIWSEETGKMTSIIDGMWVIEVTTWGVVGFVSLFGLLLYPIYRAYRQIPLIKLPRERTLLSGLAMIVAFYVIDLVPNSSIGCDLTMLAGALYSLVPGILQQQHELARKQRARSDQAAASESAESAPPFASPHRA